MKFFLMQFVTIVTVGGILGWILGSVATHVRPVANISLRFLDFAQWIPFLATWALPIWPPREPYVYTFIFLIWGLSCLVLLISTLHRHITLRTVLELDRQAVRRDLVRNVLLKGFFICLISQMWLQPYGWHWFAMYEPNWTGRVLINLLILIVSLSLINLVLLTDFDQIAERHSSALHRQRSLMTRSSLWGSLLLFGLCILAWHLLGNFLNSLFGLVPLVDVLAAVSGIVSSLSSTTLGTRHSVAYHMATSLTEILAGVGIAAVLVFLLTKFSTDRPRMRNVVRLLIPYTYVIPVLASLFALGWPTPVRIAFGVALISIYPSMEVIWRSANSQGYRCIPMAIAEALPFGYVGMFFGEAMFSTAGVYLLIISSRSQQTTASTAVAWVVLVVLSHLFLSCVFRWLAYRSWSQRH